MHLKLIDRQNHSCPSGYQWYVCKANGFTGCCSVDACDYSTCPDTVATSSSSSVRTMPKTSRSSSTPKASSTPSLTSSASSSTFSSSIISKTPIYAPTTPVIGVASTTSASPAKTNTVVMTSSSTPKGPIIGGVIAGIIVLAIFTAMLWLFCRRRKQLSLFGGSSPFSTKGGLNRSEKFAGYSPDSDVQGRGSSGVFAPFGGYHNTPTVEAREGSYRSLPNDSNPAELSSARDADAPVPDLEKSALVQPPAHEHPANHQLPGHAPNIPVYSQASSSANPASRSHSSRVPAYDSLPSQTTNRSPFKAKSTMAYVSLPQSPPEPTYDPKQVTRTSYEAEVLAANPIPTRMAVPEESPELRALSFSPITLDTNNLQSPGTVFPYPSPTETQSPKFSSQVPPASQAGQTIAGFFPPPLSANEIVEIGSSMTQFRPPTIPTGEIAELSESPLDFRSKDLIEAQASSPQAIQEHSEATEYPFHAPEAPRSEQPGFTPIRCPSLSRARQLLRAHSSFQDATAEPLAPAPPLSQTQTSPPVQPNPPILPSLTPPPLRFKKRSPEPIVTQPTLKKIASAKDLPFNYISLPSPNSPITPSGTKPSVGTGGGFERLASTYGIPIGLCSPPNPAHPPLDPTTTMEQSERGNDVLLTHNHSVHNWSRSEHTRDHVMSWARYDTNSLESALAEGEEELSRVENVAMMQKMDQIAPTLLVQNGGQQEGRLDSGVAGLSGSNGYIEGNGDDGDGRGRTELKRSSRTSVRRSSANIDTKRDSARSAMVSPLSEVSPVFTPIQEGRRFSPLSPEERGWAGQE